MFSSRVFPSLTSPFSSRSCQHEYLDVFSELRRPDEDLLETPFGGRFCGMIAPRARISLYNSLVLSFYTDQTETDGDLFYGTYQFINACKSMEFRRSARERRNS